MDQVVKRVVVTGAEGFIGKRLVKCLAAEGYAVLALDQNPHTEPPLPGVEYRVSDLSDPAGILANASLEREGFALVHLAWALRRGASFSDQALDVRLLAGLLDKLGDRGMRQLLAVGSADEYGQRSGVLLEDDEPVLPLTPYGWGKRAARLMALSWAQRTGMPLLWIRPVVIYGPGQTGDMLIPYAIHRALARQNAEFSDGLQERDFVYVDDVVEGIVRGVQRAPRGVHSVNLGCGVPVKVRDVLVEIARLLDAASLFRLDAKNRRPGEPEVRVAEVRKAEDVLGWRARVDWREGLRMTCEAARQ